MLIPLARSWRRRGRASRTVRRCGSPLEEAVDFQAPTEIPRFSILPQPAPAVHGADAGTAAVAAGRRPLFPSLSTLLAGHLLRDGEVVLLMLKPSLWSIPFGMLRFAAAVLIAVIATVVWLPAREGHWYAEAGAFLLAGRAMWSILQWMGRLYVLTDMRILRVAGVFTVEVFDCPLRRVAQTRVTRSFRERLFQLGSIEIVPRDETVPPGVWQTVCTPVEVHEQIISAINRAKFGGMPGEWS
jgi:hypothetical protein